MPGPTGELDPPTFVGALRFRGAGFEVWAGTNEGRLFGGPGAPTWAQVLASGRVTGGVGNNPHIDSGDILSFGDSGSLPVTGTIRSSTDIEMRAAGGLELTSDATMQLQAIGSIPIRLVTNATERLRIGGDGAWRVDGDEGTAGQILTSNGPGATPTWEDAPGGGAQGWDDVLAVDNNSGANNPHIDTGQFIGFGTEGSLPGSGQLRSSANWTANVTGIIELRGSTNAFLFGNSGLSYFGVVSGAARVRTSATTRLEIGTAGGWALAGDEGSARHTIQSAGTGTPPTWGDPVEVRDSGVDQGDVYVLDFEAGTNCNLAVNVASRVATITPSVDLSSVTYTAGDGIDLTGQAFSADVSDFAGTGLEDDGANNLRIAAAAAGAGLTGGGGSALAVGAGTGITVNANDVAWNGVTMRSVSSGNVGPRRAVRLIESSVYTWALVDDAANDEVEVTLQLNAIPLSSMATIAQSRILGRAEGAGTGTITELTPTEVVSIIDGENATWTGDHQFNGDFTVNNPGGSTIQSTTGTTVVAGGTLTMQGNNGSAAGGAEIRLATAVVIEGTSLVRISTGSPLVERLEFEPDGAWQLGGDTGTSGFPMICGGASAPPTWARVGASGIDLTGTYAWTGVHSFTSSSASIPFQVNCTSGEAQFNASVFTVDANTDVLIEAANAMTLKALGLFQLQHDGGEHVRLNSDDGTGGFLFQESASDSTPLVPNGYGMWWTRTIGPNTYPWFTNSADEDFPLLAGQAGTVVDVTSTSTTANTVTHTMLANTNLAGTTYRLEAFVTYVKTAVNTTDPRFVIQIGGTNVAFIQIDQNANAGTHYFRLHGHFVVRSLGTAGVATYAVGLQVVGENNSAQVVESIVNTPAAGTLNTTIDQTIGIGVALAASVASNSISINTATIERVYR